jgi:hypothetical protein
MAYELSPERLTWDRIPENALFVFAEDPNTVYRKMSRDDPLIPALSAATLKKPDDAEGMPIKNTVDPKFLAENVRSRKVCEFVIREANRSNPLFQIAYISGTFAAESTGG